eukprot:6084738-Prymnesium_polylepis.1
MLPWEDAPERLTRLEARGDRDGGVEDEECFAEVGHGRVVAVADGRGRSEAEEARADKVPVVRLARLELGLGDAQPLCSERARRRSPAPELAK